MVGVSPRWLGVFLVVAGGTLYGLGLARSLRSRVREIDDLVIVLNALESEIASLYAPLPEACERVARIAKGATRRLLIDLGRRLSGPEGATVATAWTTAIAEWAASTSLEDEELDVLRTLGGVIGRTAAHEQVRAIRYATQRLTRLRDRLESDLERQSRMRLYFGVAGGVTLAILLV